MFSLFLQPNYVLTLTNCQCGTNDLTNMCTITLTYDGNNVLAQQEVAKLRSTGLFKEIREVEEEEELPELNYNDPYLWEDHGDLPPLPEGKDTFTPEEAYKIIMADIRKIYDEDDAV